jgi:hypothetical protein
MMRVVVRYRIGLILAFCLGALCLNGPADAVPSTPTTLTLMDIHGRAVAPLAAGAAAPRVFFFLSQTCPLCSEYAPEIGRLCDMYTPRGVAFSVVYTDADIRPAQARQHYTQHKFSCAALLDPAHRLSSRLGATVTPEVVVVDAKGRLLYRGRIDNRLLSWGVTHDPNVADLSAALDAIRQGQPVARPWHQAIGCAIPKLTVSRPTP